MSSPDAPRANGEPAPLKAPYPAGALERFGFAGAVDADGHVLEPARPVGAIPRAALPRPRPAHPQGRPRAEYMEIDGRPSKLVRNGMPPQLGAMDRIGGIALRARADDRARTTSTWRRSARWTRRERIARLDLENIERSFLYPDPRRAVGGGVRRRGAHAGVSARLQPLDRRLLRRLGGPARSDRAALARRSRRRRSRAAPRGRATA